MKEYSGLDKLRSVSGNGVYCPKCGDYLKVVMNGFFHGELLFCPKEKRVFAVTLKDITKLAGKDFLKQAEAEIGLDKLRSKIVISNFEEAQKLLKDL